MLIYFDVRIADVNHNLKVYLNKEKIVWKILISNLSSKFKLLDILIFVMYTYLLIN